MAATLGMSGNDLPAATQAMTATTSAMRIVGNWSEVELAAREGEVSPASRQPEIRSRGKMDDSSKVLQLITVADRQMHTKGTARSWKRTRNQKIKERRKCPECQTARRPGLSPTALILPASFKCLRAVPIVSRDLGAFISNSSSTDHSGSSWVGRCVCWEKKEKRRTAGESGWQSRRANLHVCRGEIRWRPV